MTPDAYVTHLQRLLERAVEHLAFETSDRAGAKTLERVATAVLEGERAARRIRAFAVRCDDAPAPDEGLVLEVSWMPPAPRARAVLLRVRAR